MAVPTWIMVTCTVAYGLVFNPRVAPDPSAKRLLHQLMTPYESLVKPSGGQANQLTVKLGLRLSQVLDMVRK